MKNNQFSQFNNQTAQRRELDNVFNTNALAHFDTEVNYQLPRGYQMVRRREVSAKCLIGTDNRRGERY